MTLNISSGQTISAVQAAFSARYPYLKIEFFTKPHEVGASSWSKFMIFERDTPLGEIEGFKGDGTLTFDDDTSVATLEQSMQEEFGLYIQVFRKSMSAWIETTSSDHWALAFQNQKGEESNHSVAEMIYVPRSDEG